MKKMTPLQLLMLVGITNIGFSLVYAAMETGTKHFNPMEAGCSALIVVANGVFVWLGLRKKAYYLSIVGTIAAGWWIRHAFIHNLCFR